MIILHGKRNIDCSLSRLDGFNHFWSRELEQMGTEQILRWVVDHLASRFAVATAFEPNGCVLVAMLSKMCRRIDVIETSFGCSIYDTYHLKSELQAKYGIEFRCQNEFDEDGKYYLFDTHFRSRTGLQRFLCRRGFESLHRSPPVYDVLICCDTREQIRHGEHLPIMERDSNLNVTKIYPLARWTKDSVWQKIDCDSIPYIPFFENKVEFQRSTRQHSIDRSTKEEWLF